MTAGERGLLLLCTELGDGQKPLSTAQFRALKTRVLAEPEGPAEPDRPVTERDLEALGFAPDFARRVRALLDRKAALDAYLSVAAELGIHPITRLSPDYPRRLFRLGEQAPAVLFCRGDPALLRRPAVALVGSRTLTAQGRAFARRVGELAAAEGYALVSGNAVGADRAAQEACLAAGGAVIAVLPDSLGEHDPAQRSIVYLCRDGWHLPMVSYRALERNRLIHCLGEKTLVAQSNCRGGTWEGSLENLRRGWSPLFVHNNGSPGCGRLIDAGAAPVSLEALTSLRALRPMMLPLTEQ